MAMRAEINRKIDENCCLESVMIRRIERLRSEVAIMVKKRRNLAASGCCPFAYVDATSSEASTGGCFRFRRAFWRPSPAFRCGIASPIRRPRSAPAT
jgi:hypothetical protein